MSVAKKFDPVSGIWKPLGTSASGRRGLSAYEIAQSLGFAGSPSDWQASLRGEKGDPGNNAGPIEGRGSPVGLVTGPIGTTYLDRDVTLGALLWIKKSNDGASGWSVTEGDTGRVTTLTSCFIDPYRASDGLNGAWIRRTPGFITAALAIMQESGVTTTGTQFMFQFPPGFLPDALGAATYLPSAYNSSRFTVGTSGRFSGYSNMATGVGGTQRAVYDFRTRDTDLPWPTAFPV